jgi:ABC-type multidrug transport system ATPase subunit
LSLLPAAPYWQCGLKQETYGLLGPNRAGKTAIISMAAGLYRADAGSVDVAGGT